MKNRFLSLLALLLFTSTLASAQNIKFTISDSTKMSISGTSTLHSWISAVQEVNGAVEFEKGMIERGSVKKGDKIPSVYISFPVKSIISERGSAMDKKTYDALKMEEHPEIIFNLSKGKVISVSGDAFTVEAKGNLEVAGVKKEIEFTTEGKILDSSQYIFTGSYDINMVAYNMKPPSALFGTIETGEDVVINFELVLERE